MCRAIRFGVVRAARNIRGTPSCRWKSEISLTFIRIFALVLLAAVVGGCKGNGLYGVAGGALNSGTAPVVLMLTDGPAINTTILSTEVTLTGATLNPGSVSLLPAAAALELTQLQTDTAYLSTTNVPPGNYTSLVLTFANPAIAFENDTGAVVVAGTGTPTPACASGAVCTIQPVATNLTATIPLAAFTLAASTPAGLLVDVSLSKLLVTAMGVDFQAGTSVSQFMPGGTGSPAVGAEDVVGRVSALNAPGNTITIQNAQASYTLTANSATSYFQFPSSSCATAGFACLTSGQILSVDIGIQSDGTPVARNVVFEDADSSDTEVEGIVTAINADAQTLNMVTLTESSAIAGLNIGDVATVHYGPTTPLDVDFEHADSTAISTAGFLFSAANQDLALGQQVQVRRNPASSGSSVNADRIRLRSSRLSGTIQSVGVPILNLGGNSPPYPSLFSANGITQLQVQTSMPTIFTGMTITGLDVNTLTQLSVGNVVSTRGPLFNVAGSRTLQASRVELKQ